MQSLFAIFLVRRVVISPRKFIQECCWQHRHRASSTSNTTTTTSSGRDCVVSPRRVDGRFRAEHDRLDTHVLLRRHQPQRLLGSQLALQIIDKMPLRRGELDELVVRLAGHVVEQIRGDAHLVDEGLPQRAVHVAERGDLAVDVGELRASDDLARRSDGQEILFRFGQRHVEELAEQADLFLRRDEGLGPLGLDAGEEAVGDGVGGVEGAADHEVLVVVVHVARVDVVVDVVELAERVAAPLDEGRRAVARPGLVQGDPARVLLPPQPLGHDAQHDGLAPANEVVELVRLRRDLLDRPDLLPENRLEALHLVLQGLDEVVRRGAVDFVGVLQFVLRLVRPADERLAFLDRAHQGGRHLRAQNHQARVDGDFHVDEPGFDDGEVAEAGFPALEKNFVDVEASLGNAVGNLLGCALEGAVSALGGTGADFDCCS